MKIESPPDEKGVDLLNMVRKQGYSVSSLQLVRWHRAGLLPRPRQQPLKAGRGTCSLYPPGTGEQLLLLCSLHVRERRLSRLAWELWLAGYRVEYQLIHVQLQQASTRLHEWTRRFADLKQIASQHDFEQALDLIERYAAGSLPLQPLRRLRKRVGRAHFSSFLVSLFRLAMEEDSEKPGSVDEHERQLDLRILARGLGLEKRFVSQQDALEYYLTGFLIPRLRWFFAWLQEVDWEDLLEDANGFEIIQARDNLRTWLMHLGNARQFRGRLPADYPRWELDFQEIFRHLPANDQALVLVIWSGLRALTPAQRDRLPVLIIGPTGAAYGH